MLTRRSLLAASTALSLAPSVRAFAAPASATAATTGPVLVTVFLRGGMDSLAVVAPVDDVNYTADRPPEMRLLADGDKPALRLDRASAGLDFRLHPEMGALRDLYQSERIALVHASGIANGTRSHFGAQELIERGIGNPDETARIYGGWMARWLAAAGGARAPAFVAGAGVPEEFATHADTIAAGDLRGGMNVPGGKQAQTVLDHLYREGNGAFEQAGRRTLRGITLIDSHLREPDGKMMPYKPTGNAAYEETEIGRGLMTVARVIRMDLGIRAFAVDMGGWDTHENQPPRLASLVGQLSRALGAFHEDLHAKLGDVVVVVMSEFGRRLRSNKSNGTDHGHAGLTLVSAPRVLGGRLHGVWPGLSSDKLDNAVDLAMTTDIRSILAELMTGPLNTPAAASAAFPNFTPKKVGLFA
jgi:uncharacterized protein (DUF1501 family)